ncbi:hypothetical protein K439DRAFT_1644437 [Ramaria rubella]|nr:hypothetical protein K439DRAFT_1644437 [Ramaria rubella]
MQTLVEMLCSGELANYGLATLNKILDAYGDDQGVGYDIACSHMTTVAASSIAAKAQTHHLLLAVNAFHGHAHNLLCQLQNHPMYIPGLSIEDLETCERVFSASNSVAHVVRYASHYHWCQFIDLHYQQWDEDKYFELSKFLYNNYKQALAIIMDYTPKVEWFKAIHGFEDTDFVKWHDEQLEYLKNLKDELERDVLQTDYVKALEKLAKAE